MKRLLVVRLGSLGDLVHTVPAVAALRRAHPSAEIDWLVDPGHQAFLMLVPVISSIQPLAGRSPAGWLATCRSLRARAYDVALDFQGLIKSAALARLSGAREVVGFERRALRERAAAYLYTRRVGVRSGRHVIEKNLQLAASEGAALGRIEFPIAEVDSPAAVELAGRGIDAFALLNPGAAWPNKRWPPDRFGRLAEVLRTVHGLTSVVLWGPGERALADAVAATSHGAALAAPPTLLPDVVALARRARLMVSGDTGPLHLAAAVGTPVVALFGPTSSRRNGPWRRDDQAITRHDRCRCAYRRRCRLEPGTWCLGRIGVDEVIATVGRRLGATQLPVEPGEATP